MSLFIDSQGNYPRHIGDLLLEHPDYNGTDLPEGWKLVEQTDQPIPELGHVVLELDFEIVDNNYIQRWATRPLTEQEIASHEAFLEKRREEYGITSTEL